MAHDNDLADDLIPGSLKRSKSYHSDYGKKTYKEIKDLAAANPPDQNARQMKKADRTDRAAAEEREGAAVMNSLRGFKQKLARVARLWEDRDYDTALGEVESMLKTWPGNAHLHILWASLVQLQEGPQHGLAEAKQALQQAIDLDKDSPAGAIELGYFLDNVEDDPQAAAKVYADGVAAARQLLIDGLIGQAKALRQLDKMQEFHRCLREVVFLSQFENGSRRNRVDETGADVVVELPTGHFYAVQLKGPHAEPIRELLSELVGQPSADQSATPERGR